MRAGDDDRHRVAAALSDAFARGQPDHGKPDARTEQVWSARHRGELLAPLSDLMPDAARALDEHAPTPRTQVAPLSPQAGAETARRHVTGEPGGLSLSPSVAGMSQKRGDWLCSSTHTTAALRGSTVVDLWPAHLSSTETTINAFGAPGSVDVLRRIRDTRHLRGHQEQECHRGPT